MMLGNDLPWQDRGPLPYFWGSSFEEHVSEWRRVDREAQAATWRLAAIAFSLERASGGRPRGLQKRLRTTIQQFCDAVKIDRQSFQRLCRTYRVFFPISRTSGVTSFEPDLPFKFFEVAARLAGSEPLDAIVEARDKRWSANRLQRELEARREPSQKRRARVSLLRARERIVKMMEAWIEQDRRDAVAMLRNLADEIEEDLGPPPPPLLEWLARPIEGPPAQEQIEDDAPLDGMIEETVPPPSEPPTCLSELVIS